MLFDKDWYFYKDGQEQKKRLVTLPFDAMLYEKRDISNLGGSNISYFAGGKYYFEKSFSLSLQEGERVYFEFEGIYMDSKIYINGKLADYRPYGYSDFYFDATDLVKDGDNFLKVEVNNQNQPNSRWYTGSGIYRPVHLFVFPKEHILPRSLKIKTMDYKKRLLALSCDFSCQGDGKIEIFDRDGKIVLRKDFLKEEHLNEEIELEDGILWDDKNPYLYTLKVTFEKDSASSHFGIRQIALDEEKGFLINGKRVILYGACIHHDNGLLGAVDDPCASQRKIQILKDAGYNAIRSAHNPLSQSMLEACDKIGMLVLDEYADCWYIHKTKYDYASYALSWYKKDLKDMVDKDYNHPCVIMYSEGNEVAETSQKKGIEFVDTMTKYLHSLDDTRPCTCGVNIFFNALFSLGFGVYSDKKAEQNAKAKPTKKKKSVGSEFFNNLAGLLGADFMKTGATLPQSDRKTRDAFAKLDVAGYNYGIKRYKHDLKKYPHRFILGSETFCSDAGKFASLAKANPRIIGDFVWAGWDYIGEAGIGSWVACESKEIYQDKAGWLLAGSGRIDILGDENAEMGYTRTAFGKEAISLACVSPRDYELGHSPSSWKFSWSLNAYDFPSYEGKRTEAEIYSQAYEVALYLDDKLLFRKKKGNKVDGHYKVKITYQPGVLKAVAYDKDHKVIGESKLSPSKKETKLSLIKEKTSILSDELLYLKFHFTDEDLKVKPLINEEIEVVDVKGGKLLGLGNGCPYYKGSYLDNKTKSYYGKAMAIFKPTILQGNMEITVLSKYGKETVSVPVEMAGEKEDRHL